MNLLVVVQVICSPIFVAVRIRKMLRLITVILVAVSASASILVPKKLCTDHKPGQGKGGCDVVDTCKHGGKRAN